MMTRTALVFAALLLMWVDGAAVAAQDGAATRGEPAQVMVQRISLDQAVVIAQQRSPGRVVGADTRVQRGRMVHEVRLLEESGRLRIVRVDAETGRVTH